ncbi:MAG: endolytic transglycosylase MltG [Flavobacteriales bacterium]|nr:endolytic transglycosylase MltG [Flavobacteriales bacterium]
MAPWAKRMLWAATAAVLLAAGAAFWLYRGLLAPSTRFDEESRVVLIPTGADEAAAMDSLRKAGAVGDERVFKALVARGRIKPGRYRIRRGMTTRAMVRMLHGGEQEPVRLTFTNIRRLEQLAGRLGRVLEPDSMAFLRVLRDPATQRTAGLDERSMIGLFLPNTYEFWWNTTPERFVERMRKEHERFWNAARTSKADALGLSPQEVSTLASIVQAETVRMADAMTIARVYLNRLRIGMPLQADPTLTFALGLDTVSRVLNADKLVDSPYNTYRNTGLPPGPINMPEPRFIDAVLDAPPHEYLYFCARADLSGFSDFSRTYEQHLVNARRYQRALNQRKIYR